MADAPEVTRSTTPGGRRCLSAAVQSLLAMRPGSRRWPFRLLDRAPFTSASLLALAVTTATLAGSRGRAAHLLPFSASTNLHNLTAHPLDVLFASAFWVASAWMFLPMAAVLVLVLGTAERRVGSRPVILFFVVGHVGATLLTVAGIALGVSRGWFPTSLTYAVDVGPSYGLVAVAALLIACTRSGRRRHAKVAALMVILVLVVVVDRTFTDVGHLLAALIGFLVVALPVVRRRASGAHGDERGAQLVAPVRQGRLVVEPEAAVAQRNDVEVADIGDRRVA
jgi:hypothetical protein